MIAQVIQRNSVAHIWTTLYCVLHVHDVEEFKPEVYPMITLSTFLLLFAQVYEGLSNVPVIFKKNTKKLLTMT